MTTLVEALDADHGVTVVVGAGGKKSLLYALARRVDKAVLTTTVRIPLFDDHVASVAITDDPDTALRETDEWPMGVVPRQERRDRYEGYEPSQVDALASTGRANAILVKGDGARTRWLKAPNDREPQIPRSTDRVVPIASAKVVGERLADDHVHRPELVEQLTGRAIGERITPADVATVLTHPEGGLKSIPASATVVPVINMVDGPAEEDAARTIASQMLSHPELSRVVLTKLVAEHPVVDVIDRP